MDTANRVHQMALEDNYEMIVVGIPKPLTMISFNDHCPGYGVQLNFWLQLC